VDSSHGDHDEQCELNKCWSTSPHNC